MPDLVESNHTRIVLPEDVLEVIDNMRPADVREVLALGSDPEQAILNGIQVSRFCRSVVDSSGRAVAMFGMASHSCRCGDEVGVPWLLGTPSLRSVRIGFLKESKFWVRQMHKFHPVLWNVVDARNDLHLTWLKWVGFDLTEPQALGRNGELFRHCIKVI